MIEIAVSVDGEGLAHEEQQIIEAAGWRVSGQAVRRDGMPVVYLTHDNADHKAASLMRQKLNKAYGG
jgi:hypothetical protein